MKHQRFYALTALIARKASRWSHEGIASEIAYMEEEIYSDAPRRFCDEIQQVIYRIRTESDGVTEKAWLKLNPGCEMKTIADDTMEATVQTVLDVWPRHSNGRPMKIGDMTPSQRVAVAREAVARLAPEFTTVGVSLEFKDR